MKTSQAGLDAIKDYIGEVQDDDALRMQMYDAEDAVNDLVLVTLTQGQFDALVSLCSNIGRKEFEQSILLDLLNRDHYLDAANQFPRYSAEDVQLHLRRFSERARFLEALT